MSRARISIVAAIGLNRELGIDNQLLGNFPTDMRHFSELTQGGIAIMGRKTFDSLRKKPLPNRDNIVISHNPVFWHDNTLVAKNCVLALELAQSISDGQKAIFVIGGASIYQQFLDADLIDQIFLTEIQALFPNANKFFPPLTDKWRLSAQTVVDADGVTMHFSTYLKTRR